MIVYELFHVIQQMFIELAQWLPRIDVLPFGLDYYVQLMISGLKAFIEIFPPLGTIFNAFIIYLSFLLALRIFKMIPIVHRFIPD